jgi:hypothetical protein
MRERLNNFFLNRIFSFIQQTTTRLIHDDSSIANIGSEVLDDRYVSWFSKHRDSFHWFSDIMHSNFCFFYQVLLFAFVLMKLNCLKNQLQIYWSMPKST